MIRFEGDANKLLFFIDYKMDKTLSRRTHHTVIDTFVELDDGTRVQVTDLFRRSMMYKFPQEIMLFEEP